MRLSLILICAAIAVPACAGPPKSPDLLANAQARGKSLAEGICAICHAVGQAGASPDRRAPPFRTLSGAFVPLTLQRKLTEIAETGHYAMPAVKVDSEQISDLTAYINSLPSP